MSGRNSALPADGGRSALMDAATNGDALQVKRLLGLDSCLDTPTSGDTPTSSGLTHTFEAPEEERKVMREMLSLNISPRDFHHQKDFELLNVVWNLGNECVNAWILADIEKQLRPIADEKNKEKLDLSDVMHLVAFVRVPGLMTILASQPKFLNINVENGTGQTPLHMAAFTGNEEAVEGLTGQPNLLGSVEDKFGQTALELAFEIGWWGIYRTLSQRRDVRDYLEDFLRWRAYLLDAAKTLLVGAALVAGITFTGWLAPPLGYQQNYQYPRAGAPSDRFEQYAAIDEYLSIKVFWIANSMSFYLSIAAIMAANGCVMRSDYFINEELRRLRGGVQLAQWMFFCSVCFVLIAFTAAGFAALPPDYIGYMVPTVGVGLLLCYTSFVLPLSPESIRGPELDGPMWHFVFLRLFPWFYHPTYARCKRRRAIYKEA